jgi:hypothetical protein
MAPPTRISSDRIDLPDGRNVRVLSYADGSLRFRITDANSTGYALTEAFLTGGMPVILKVVKK